MGEKEVEGSKGGWGGDGEAVRGCQRKHKTKNASVTIATGRKAELQFR